MSFRFLAQVQFDHGAGCSSPLAEGGYIFHGWLVICCINQPPVLENALSPGEIVTRPIHNCELIFLNAGCNMAVYSEHVLWWLA